MKWYCRSFGLNIESEIPLPPLPPADPGSNIDVVIRHGKVAKTGITGSQEIGAFCQARPGLLWLHVPGVAWFLVSEGRQIEIMPEPEADWQTVRIYLLGSAMGALLHQRGLLVLHGNAIRFGQQAVAFCGESGAGKSTLSAALVKRGFQLLTDDVCVIDRQGQVQPGYPELKLWQDTMETLDIPLDELTPVRAKINKYAWTLLHEFHARPLPIAAIYLLSDSNLQAAQLRPLKGMEKYLPLKNQTYRSRYLDGLGLTAHHLQLCGRLTGQVDVTQLCRARVKFNKESVTTLLDTILAELSSKGINVEADLPVRHQSAGEES
jgi:hypothetical protein